jgi:hypothetical protein
MIKYPYLIKPVPLKKIEYTFCHGYYVKKICENELSKLRPLEYSNFRNSMTNFLQHLF